MLSQEEHDGRSDVHLGHLATDTHTQLSPRNTDDMIIVKGILLKCYTFLMYAIAFIHPVKGMVHVRWMKPSDSYVYRKIGCKIVRVSCRPSHSYE